MDDISIIIPVGCTKSRLPYIGPIAQYYVRHNPKHEVEIVIAEYGNEMLYKDIAEELQAKYLFIAKNTQYYNKSKAVNAGIISASSETCVMADSDMLPPNNIAQLFTRELNKYDAVWPCFYYYSTITPQNWVKDNGIYRLNRKPKDGRRRIVRNATGGIFGINKTAYMSIGGMNEDFDGYGYEDTEFFVRAAANLKVSTPRNQESIHMTHGADPGHSKFRENAQRYNRLRKLAKDKNYIKSLKTVLEKY